MTKEVIAYLTDLSLQRKAYLASIRGDIGSGKTLFARCLIDELIENDHSSEIEKPKETIFCSSLNSETQY